VLTRGAPDVQMGDAVIVWRSEEAPAGQTRARSAQSLPALLSNSAEFAAAASRMRAMPQPSPSIRLSLEEYGRGIAGGFIFAVPLLFTMEVWWSGFLASPVRLLAGMVGTFVLLLGYNEYAGLREDHSFLEVIVDSIEELGLGLLIAFGSLALFGRIQSWMAPREIIGKIVVEGLLVGIGVSVGTAQLGGDPHRPAGADKVPREPWNAIVLSFCGAVLLAANVGPTEEILVLGAHLLPEQLLLTMAASVLLAAVVLFFSEFRGSRHLSLNRAPRIVLGGCVVTYATALVASASILWFFGRFDDVSLAVGLGQVVVLGFAATLGASAGRLLLQ
jgi:putative integral membrane protein (TIGR02587 family)